MQIGQVSVEADWIKAIASGGGLVVVAWVMMYVFKTLLPKLLDQFSADLKAQREGFAEDLRAQRVEFSAELRAERSQRTTDIERIGGAVDRLTDAIVASNQLPNGAHVAGHMAKHKG